ncbi:uncharacterized protein LTR77_008531 [Saxophila tyrrhenica]|uniref:Manganese lipoxygenase n=1 Tax=Saxophila tyrrhenica TaxID=1690608 RepID=A0AAV9P4X9_9PEZI|nr:hypothetical protein LTR77_008531 [Saxophila tyrrhenica]
MLTVVQTVLFAPGTVVDQIFPYTGQSAQDYTTDRYKNKGSGRFESNYFESELGARGLINSNVGPALKSFPFYEDASTIHDAIERFMATFVNSFYATKKAITRDAELQAWVTEAQGPAEAIDFPSITSNGDLIDVLTHIAHLASTSHHTVNTNELIDISSTLPFHPPALYKPIPTRKGIKNVANYLPPFNQVLTQFAVGALFARPKFVGSKRALLHMFDDPNMLDRMNPKTRKAAAKFKKDMQAFSADVSGRTFDTDGLSQGMPFVWRALDPNVAPYSITT